MPNKITVAVLFGGIGSEEEVSCNSGINCILQLDQTKYDILPVRLLPNKTWLTYNQGDFQAFSSILGFMKLDVIDQILTKKPSTEFKFFEIFDPESQFNQTNQIDIFLNLIHGTFGEDGQLSTLLDQSNIPYIGPSAENACLTMNKYLTGQILANNRITTPKTVQINNLFTGTLSHNDLLEIHHKLEFPIVAKPNKEGSSAGLFFFDSIEQIKEFKFPTTEYLFQEKLIGDEFTVPVIYHNNSYQAFQSIALKLPENSNFDYDAKYTSSLTQEICPAPIDHELEQQLQQIAIQVNQILDCTGITRTDMMVNPQTGQITVLEINTIPGMTRSSFVPKFCHLYGYTFPELLDELIASKLK
jgi:D-alanine-D-alanine ligase